MKSARGRPHKKVDGIKRDLEKKGMEWETTVDDK